MQLDTTDARKIAAKLGATLNRKRPNHELAVISHDGKFVASFGIRRGSGEQGHDHIMNAIHVRPREARGLADCNVSQQDWIDAMKEKGIISRPT